MTTGKIKWFNPAKGYGFIENGTGGKDVFLHVSALEKADVLLVMTPWPEFSGLTASNLAKSMNGRVVIDPYQVLDGIDLVKNGFTYATLGEPLRRPITVSD